MAAPRIAAPLTGTVTTGSWVAKDITVSGVTLPSGKAVHFEYLLPAQYSTAAIYPIMIWLHPQSEGNNWYSSGTSIANLDAEPMYNNVAFRTNYPCICIIGYADQTTDTAGGAVENWGGWINAGVTGSGTVFSGDTGPNVFALNGVVAWVIANLSADSSRVYLNGFGMGGIGAEYLMLKYNQINGSPKLYTAATSTGGVLEIHGSGAGPTAADVATMASVPVWWVSGQNDGSALPADWNLPMWRSQAGNSTYPAAGGTEAQARAGSSQMHLWYPAGIGHQATDATGKYYGTYSQILNFMFSQVGPTAGTGQFVVAGGNIIDPFGNKYVARGINIADTNMASVSTSAAVTPLLTLFRGLNFVRVACYSYQPPSYYATFISQATAKGIVVELEDHTSSDGQNRGGGTGVVYTGTLLTNELTWYTNLARTYSGNTYVWFGTDNEPSENPSAAALTAWQNQTVSAIRGTGSNAIIMVEMNCDANTCGAGYTASTYTSMHNIVWDVHYYNWLSGYSTSLATNQTELNKLVSATQTFTSGDVTVPVIIGEYGNSTTGASVDAGATQAIQAVQGSVGANTAGCVAWWWNAGSFDNLTDGGNPPNLTAYGQTVATWIASGTQTGSPRITPANVMAFFNSMVGTRTISGQFIERGPLDPITAINTSTGKWLGLIGGDYYWYGSPGPADTSVNAIAINYWNAGGLFILTVGIPNPQTGGSSSDTSAVNFTNLTTTGNAVNTNWMNSLSQIATGLAELRDAGVVVLFRPYHESNGTWLWYGTQNFTAAQMITIWKTTHDYMVNTKGLNNLIWVYSQNTDTGNLTANWPGSAYADMTGQDLYTSTPTDGLASYNSLLTLNVPTSLTEFGPGSPTLGNASFDELTLISAIKNSMPKNIFWQQWWDGNGGNVGWGMASTDQTKIKAAITNAWVMNRGDFTIAATPVTPSPNNTVVIAPSTAAITDAAGKFWTITSGAQVAVNGVTDTTTANVVELAYVNSVVWHKNTSNNWYSWSGSAWVGPTTTSPVPVVSPSGTTVIAPSTAAITDTAFNLWTITSTAQVAVGGVTDTITANVVELAYVNLTIWHKNTSNLWYGKTSPSGTWAPAAGTTISPLSAAPGGISYIQPMKAAGLRVITYIKQESPSAFSTGLTSLRTEQTANRDIFAYEGCQEPDTAVIVGTPETLADGASFQQTLWSAAQADSLPAIQTSFGITANYGTTGNLAAFTTYANAHTYTGTLNCAPNDSGTAGFIDAMNTAALLTSPGRAVAHTEFGWKADRTSATAIASYALDFIMAGFFQFNVPYYIYHALYDDTTGQWGLFNSDQSPRLVATALANLFTLLKDTASNALSFGPGKLNVSISGLPVSPSGPWMGGSFGVLQKSDGSFWLMVRNEQTLMTSDANGDTPITVAPVNITVTLGTIATSIDVYDPLIGTTAQQHVANSSSITVSLPAHPILIKIVRP